MTTVEEMTPEEERLKYEVYGNVCVYCGEKNILNDEVRPLTPDHVIPLVRGGSNWISNILPSCLTCNLTKSTKTFEEYLYVLPQEEQEEIMTRIYLAEHPEEDMKTDVETS